MVQNNTSDTQLLPVEKIGLYKDIAFFIKTSHFYLILSFFPSIRKAIDTIMSFSISGVEDLQEEEGRLKKSLDVILTSPSYLVWQYFNRLKKSLFSARYKKIMTSNRLWPTTLPLVSVVISCFNYGKYLKDTLVSLERQTFRRFEILIVDDGSNEQETIEILKNLQGVQIIYQPNRGLATARNNGIARAHGKYICCLDADDLLKPTYLQKCVEQLEIKSLDICYSYFEEFEENNRKHIRDEFLLTKLIFANIAIVPAVYRKSLWEKVRGYDEQMKDGYEDWEFYIRAAKAGAVGKVIPEYLFQYRVHAGSMLFQTKKKHFEILKYIHGKHKDIYGDYSKQLWLENRQKIKYIVSNERINLT